ncbi:nucleotidyltransferase domain-containing protein [Candidatus Bathyarchaeota archaeon]|nr:nucleotidyltransferase domain-containing protein [Candidatus Bathyarchaeota archaeon]
MKFPRRDEARLKVAREAALLLYTSQEKEYKQAKTKAARTLRLKVYPSNREVAEELDRLAEEMEGKARADRLIKMRKEALRVMEALREFNPILIGSVWRGTAHRNSDVDIEVYAEDPKVVTEKLRKKGFKVLRSERKSTGRDEDEGSLHIYLWSEGGFEVELTIRPPEMQGKRRRCEVYGDYIVGLDVERLRKVLEEDPLRRFLPK